MYPSEKDKQYFFDLLARYSNGRATPAEAVYVERLLAILEYRRTDVLESFAAEKDAIGEDIRQRLLESIRMNPAAVAAETPTTTTADQTATPTRPNIIIHRIHFLRRRSWAAAAIAGLILLSTTWFYTHIHQNLLPPSTVAAEPTTDIKPGTSGALLTLSDGRQITLDSLHNGVIAVQPNAAVQLKDGKLLYDKTNGAGPGNSGQIAYNTMSTPRGRQFQLVLPDGTKVWLNAASTLRYPTSFTGNQRKVEITGEAYFEVAKDMQRPFHVTINEETEVEVLGTGFNVNAYKDEPLIATTLLEGAVRVVSKKRAQLLSPGQQVQVKNTGLQLIKEADVAQAVAWKNGSFSFVNADLPTVMRQVARWYNVDVEYKGPIPAGEFNGKIGNSLTLDQLLKGLAKTRINYRIENGNKIIILP